MMDGLVYKVQTYQENSKLLFVYTNKGKYTLISKGSLKMNSSTRIVSQYLTLISFEESNKKMFTLKNSSIVDDYSNIKNDYQMTKNAASILEVLDKLIYDEFEHEKIYIEATNALNGNLSYSHITFLIRILFYLGYAPNIRGDGRKVVGMNAEFGGIIYQGENHYLDLNYDETVLLLRLVSKNNEEIMIDKKLIEKLIYFIVKYYQYHLQISLKTLQ